MGEKFDAAKYLTKVNGRDYLEVKWRLLWLRTEHPEASITSELVKLEDGLAVFKARISLPSGGEAMGWGSELGKDFPNYIEKAETKALGRAMAALGYGTQFCEDFETVGRGEGQVVDAPVERKATALQVKAIYSIGRTELNLSEKEVDAQCQALYGRSPAQLSRRQASGLIDRLKGKATR